MADEDKIEVQPDESESQPAAADAEQAPQGFDENSPRQWFIIPHLLGFREQGGRVSAQSRTSLRFDDKIGQILIPTRKSSRCVGARRSPASG